MTEKPHESLKLEEMLAILNISYATLRRYQAAYLRADNYRGVEARKKKRGRPKGAKLRWNPEHVSYLANAINGILSETEAADLWDIRKAARRNHVRLAPIVGKLSGRKKESA